MELHWDVIGAPSSTGAHTPGVEKAPGALRKAGLIALISRGCDVDDLGVVTEVTTSGLSVPYL